MSNVLENYTDLQDKKKISEIGNQSPKDRLIFRTEDVPSFFPCIIYALQQAAVILTTVVFAPIIIADKICAPNLEKAAFIGCNFVLVGITSLIQITFGTRLSLIQGPSASFLLPIIVIAKMDGWECQTTYLESQNATAENISDLSGENDTESWKIHMRELQGSMMLASVVEIMVGLTGFSGFLLRYVGPLTICPTLLMISLSFSDVCQDMMKIHWGLSIITLAFTIGFALYMQKVPVIAPSYSKGKGFYVEKIYPFQTIPIFLALVCGYICSVIMTEAKAFPDDPKMLSFKARYDANPEILHMTSWFRIPYPGQWGFPTINTGMVLAFIMVSFCSMIESLGDYYATAQISHAPPLPAHAVNRGIAMEGIGCLITGCIGGSVSVTTYSNHIGLIGITKVASRRVFQCAAFIVIICGWLNKLGGIFTTIPQPVIGAILTLGMALVGSIGISTLKAMDMNSTRNLAILGLSLLMGFIVPDWTMNNSDDIKSGSTTFDQIIRTLLGTSIFVSGFTGCFLDNTVPGTAKERGLRNMDTEEIYEYESDISVYDLPYITEKCKQYSWTKYIPFLPSYLPSSIQCQKYKKEKTEKNLIYMPISETNV